MIVFSNSTPIEVSEGAGQVVIEIDPIASEITESTDLEISTIDGSALSTSLLDDGVGLDFNAIDNSTVTIDPNNPTTLAITVDINDDVIAESDEDFQLQITGLEDEDLNGVASIIIVDNEEFQESGLVVEGLLPEIAIDSVEQLEGDTGTTNFEFTVSLSEPSEAIITVDFSTLDSTAESEAKFESLTLVDFADYIPLDGTLEFNPGETEKTIVVEALTDSEPLTDEAPEETFLVNLANPTNADLEQFVGRGVILDDDLKPEIIDELPFFEVDNQSFLEGDLNDDIAQNFTVGLVDIDGEPVIATEKIDFSFSTVDVTTSADLDYKFIASEAASILPGQSSTSISITTIGDIQTEIDEKLFVVFSDLDPNLVQLKDGEAELSAEITILNDDAISDSDFEQIEDLDNLDDVTSEDDFGEGDETEDLDNLDVDQGANTVFRFLDSETGAYFYTDSAEERESITENKTNFIQEDSSFASVDSDSVDNEIDIFQLFNSKTGGYLYTGDTAERDFILENSADFVFEEVAFAAFETNVDNSIPVYRFFETNAGIHFYTASETERSFIEDNLSNFNFEGIAFFALPVASDVV
ncbi:MAG: Calx-beta domain-containing protein [Cyanobacteria bacterium P01_E01_bin.35]